MAEETSNPQVEQPTESKGSTAVKPVPAPPKVDKLPPFQVLLHNDDKNDMADVVDAIVEITPHAQDRAIQIMLEAHMRGLSLVLVTHRERAELYREQFATKKLRVTIEPAP